VPARVTATIASMQRWTGKVVGGVLGLVALGPFGALLGLLLGHQLDASAEEAPALSPADTGAQYFHITFRVMGHLAKADGRVSEREIAAARAVMSDLYLDPAQVRVAIECFTAGKDATFNLDAELAQLRRACAGRPDLLHVFLELQVRAALAGNDLGGPVSALLVRVASQLGISRLELAHIEAVMRIRRDSFARAPSRDTGQQLSEAYRVLETSTAASNEEVIKAYRRQLSRHHPDKLKANGLPDSMIEHAKQRTQQIIEAYELIRERRGL
jgi:DnaJ like chaperone protein